MKRLFSACAALALLLAAAAQAKASVMVLTFEGLQDNEDIGQYYNGGFGGNGSGPGPNYGVTFSPGSLALIAGSAGGSGNFSNNPSGDTIMYFLNANDAIMNVAAGFNTGFSFYYTLQTGESGGYTVYDGLNGTGSVLATANLSSTPNPYTVWVPVGVTFGGTAESIVFSGAANYVGFDDVTFGSATAGGGATPEPASLTLFGLGIAGMVGYRWRQRRKVAAA